MSCVEDVKEESEGRGYPGTLGVEVSLWTPDELSGSVDFNTI
jgi:hypothetical protein